MFLSEEYIVKEMAGQIRSVREWCQWISLSKAMPGNRFLIFLFFKGVQSLQALTAKMYLISNGLKGWQVQMFSELLYEHNINAGTTAFY